MNSKTFKQRWMRLRPWGLGLGSLGVLAYLYFTDPNNGALLPAFMGQLATPILAVWFALVMRKVVMDYVNVEELYNKLKETSVGSGIGFLGVCLVMFALLGLFGGQVRAQGLDVKTYIPAQAKEHVVTLRKEQATYWPTTPFHGNLQA